MIQEYISDSSFRSSTESIYGITLVIPNRASIIQNSNQDLGDFVSGWVLKLGASPYCWKIEILKGNLDIFRKLFLKTKEFHRLQIWFWFMSRFWARFKSRCWNYLEFCGFLAWFSTKLPESAMEELTRATAFLAGEQCFKCYSHTRGIVFTSPPPISQRVSHFSTSNDVAKINTIWMPNNVKLCRRQTKWYMYIVNPFTS